MNVRQFVPLAVRAALLQSRRRPFWPPSFQFHVAMPRRSARIQQALRASSDSASADFPPIQEEDADDIVFPKVVAKSRKRKAATAATKSDETKSLKDASSSGTTDEEDVNDCLPRTVEKRRLVQYPGVTHVIGIDEAGRGPLAGPVVAAAVWAPSNLKGIVDSKKITKEDERERLFEELLQMPDIQWAVSIMDAQCIDEINILQATLLGMRLAATALVDPAQLQVPIHAEPSVNHLGCYVVVSSSSKNSSSETDSKQKTPSNYYALIDGNKVPKDMPCEAESIVKGDGKEFCIAAASILAKVTRDRLMHAYDGLYPHFNLKQHKGYPTKDHMAAVYKHGACPIHRRTFAPLKHMEFDKDGKVIKQ